MPPNKYQRALLELKRSFESLPRNTYWAHYIKHADEELEFFCVPGYEKGPFQTFDLDEYGEDYIRDDNREPVDLPYRRLRLEFPDLESRRQFEIVASKAGECLQTECGWAIEYGVCEFSTLRKRNDGWYAWILALFDLLETPHDSYMFGRFSHLPNSNSWELGFRLVGEQREHATSDELESLMQEGMHATIDDLVLASEAAIARLTDFAPEGNEWDKKPTDDDIARRYFQLEIELKTKDMQLRYEKLKSMFMDAGIDHPLNHKDSRLKSILSDAFKRNIKRATVIGDKLKK